MSVLSRRWTGYAIGLTLGLALGLAYTWGINPVTLVNTYPALLRTDYRWDWVRLAALSYVAEGDLAQAQSRLSGLEQNDVNQAMSALIEEYAAAGRSADTLRSLTTLAEAMGVRTDAMLIYLDTPTALPPATGTPSPTPTLTPTPSPTPTPRATSPPTTPTPKPTRTPRFPTPTPLGGYTFKLVEQEQLCSPGQPPHIEVVVRDESGVELPGIEVWLTWAGAADRAITGLKPEGGAGYVDFNAEPEIDYTLSIGELGVPLVTDLRIEPCPRQKGKEPTMESWRILLERQVPPTPEP